MASKFRPMLAGEADLDSLRFPVYVTPKLDGVRALVFPGGVYSRSLKKIPNKQVQTTIHLPEDKRDPLIGMDGELIVGDPTAPDVYRKTQSFCATEEALVDHGGFRFYVFDNYSYTQDYVGRDQRNFEILKAIKNVHLVWLRSHQCNHIDDLLAAEAKYLERGFEGLILRAPQGPYKHGRSTAKEQWMLKLKRFVDSEAEIIGMDEEMENTNEAKTNVLGLTERSSHKANLRGKGRMGAIHVRDLKTRVEFKIGTGFTAADREAFWRLWQERTARSAPVIVKYKHFAIGGKDKPRFPTYQGLREGWDL